MAAMKLAILDDYQNVAQIVVDWSAVSSKVSIDVYRDTVQGDALIHRLQPYDIVCTMRERTKFPAEVLNKLPNLKLLTTTSVKNASIDIDFAKTKDIVVCGTTGKGSSTTEHTWALLLGLARHVPRDHFNVANANPLWQSGTLPFGLMGKTIGLVGLGKLGTSAAIVAHAFGMQVIAWSPHLTAERVAALPIPVTLSTDLNTLMEQSDVVSVHIVLSPSTRHIITAETLSHMKPTALLVNTSRGPLIDEEALIQCLQQKKIRGAALDVYDQEPLPLDHPIRKLDNVLLSPHMGYVEQENYEVFYGQTVENILAFLEGQPKRVIPFM